MEERKMDRKEKKVKKVRQIDKNGRKLERKRGEGREGQKNVQGAENSAEFFFHSTLNINDRDDFLINISPQIHCWHISSKEMLCQQKSKHQQKKELLPS